MIMILISTLFNYKSFFQVLLISMMSFTSKTTKKKLNNTTLKEMVLITSGNFMMGERSSQTYADKFPQHEVSVNSFYIDQTEAKWEWAALGRNPENKYPWGNSSIEKAFDKANFWQGAFPYSNRTLDGFYGTAPKASFAVNNYGLYDMAGNVWEWCQDKYNVNTYSNDAQLGRVKNPVGFLHYNDPREPLSLNHIMRGFFLCNDSYFSDYRTSRRISASRDSSFNHTGFRCVQDL